MVGLTSEGGSNIQGSYFGRSKLKKTSPVVKNGFNRVLMVKMVKIGQNCNSIEKQEKNLKI